ncbi:MAG: hypothetical protein N2376_01795 [Clostridia bacterium]|nr:hypothetical protein [Clostridia bacterium]
MNSKKISAYIFILLFILALPLCVFAETAKKTVVKDLVDNPDNTTLVIRVTWEKGEVQTTLVAPSGKRVPLVPGTPDTKVTATGTSLEAYIYNPEIGPWKIEFVGGGNGKVRAETTKIVEPLKITNLQASQAAGSNDVTVSFSSTGDRQTGTFNYEIYLITDPKDMDGKLLYSASSSVGQAEGLTLSLNEVNSFSQYYVRINATSNANGIQDFDSSVSQPFSFRHQDDIPKVTGLVTAINEEDKTLSLSWDQLSEGTSLDGYRVNLYQDDDAVPFVTEDVSTATTNYITHYTETAKKLKAEVSALRGGIAGQPCVSELNTDTLKTLPIQFTLPESRVTNRRDYRLPFKLVSPCKLIIRINDRESSYDLKADGVLDLKLEPDTNHIELLMAAADGVEQAKTFDLVLDETPPQLNIYEDINGQKVSDSHVVILGNAEQSAIVTINDNPVVLDEKGDFTFEGKLRIGKNTLVVNARDGAGNISTYKATVIRIIDFNGTYYVLAAGLVLTAIALTVYWRKGRKKA